jgi:RHS repeat-associated protein
MHVRTMWIVRLLSVAAVFFLPFVARGTPTVAPEGHAGGVFAEGMTGNVEAGGATGTMTYRYPFELPPARGGAQPRLSLVYRSTAGDGHAGYGWSLDMPVIQRAPLSGLPRIDELGRPLDNSGRAIPDTSPEAVEELRFGDRFTYDGQPLVLVCVNGMAGCPSDETQPTFFPWKFYYRLQVEGTFARFYLTGDRQVWRVQLKGGQLLTFGGEPDAVETLRAGGIVRWHPTRHEDVDHHGSGRRNYVVYRWQRLGIRGLSYLTDIYDTPPASGSAAVADFAHHTQLSWAAPPFPQTGYPEVLRATPDLRLTRVAVASKPWSGGGSREVMRAYHLQYLAERSASQMPGALEAPLWHHSFLSQIQMEGHCTALEDGTGNVAPGWQCPNGDRLPPTKFSYQGASIGGAAGTWSVEGGPPDLVEAKRALPNPASVSIGDIDRDGRPDIVHGWSETCTGEGLHAPSEPWVTADGNFACPKKGCHPGESNPANCPPDSIVGRAEPVVAYRNRGWATSGGVRLRAQHQCLDAAQAGANGFPAPISLTGVNAGYYTSFLTPANGRNFTTLGGAWGLGVWALQLAGRPSFQFGGVMVRPRDADAIRPGSNCEISGSNFDPATFDPGWDIIQVPPSDWAKGAEGNAETRKQTWYADVDGDGLVDMLSAAGPRTGWLAPAEVRLTNRYATGERIFSATFSAHVDRGPAQVPFEARSNTGNAPSLVPDLFVPPNTPEKNRPKLRAFYVDVTGDGIVDLVTTDPKESGGVPRVRPGDATGRFACDPTRDARPCTGAEPTPWYDVSWSSGGTVPWGPGDEWTADVAFHDVTGDGLADIVKYFPSSGYVQLWVNTDGRHFACVTPSCVIGTIVDDLHGTVDLGPHKLTFADMDSDGVDDVVVLAKVGAFVLKATTPIVSVLARASRPGLLTRIENGYGATTDITYETIQDLDSRAQAQGEPWLHHSRAVAHVVTSIVTHDAAPAAWPSTPFTFTRRVEYEYRDPAYDRWARSFVGFRKVRARNPHEGPAVTETTYWFGPCQNDRLLPLPQETSDLGKEEQAKGTKLYGDPEHRCRGGSDDDDLKALAGRVVRVDRYVPGQAEQLAERYLWTKVYSYGSPEVLFSPPTNRDRRVSWAYPHTVDTYLYDETLPVGVASRWRPTKGGDALQPAPGQAARKHLRQRFLHDRHGTPIASDDDGEVDPSGQSIDGRVRTVMYEPTAGVFSDALPVLVGDPVPCNEHWQCLPAEVAILDWTRGGTAAAPVPTIARHYRMEYTPGGQVQKIEARQYDTTYALGRKHTGGGAFSSGPPSTSGWHVLASYAYDATGFGNVVAESQGAQAGADGPMPCSTVAYEVPYRQFPTMVRHFTAGGCSGASLTERLAYDRGFGVPVQTIDPTGARSEVLLDAFGRTQALFGPRSEASDPLATRLDAQIAFGHHDKASYVDVRSFSGGAERSVHIVNGLGEPVMTVTQGEGGTAGEWIVSSWTQRNPNTGKLAQVRRPWSYSGSDPTQIAATATAPTPPSNNGLFLLGYDMWGRHVSTSESWGGWTGLVVAQKRYAPLAVELRDAAQAASGGSTGFTRLTYDGRGRIKRTLQHAGGTAQVVATDVTYYGTGEPKSVMRWDGMNVAYVRTLSFDTLGQLRRNAEPNTGNNWRYAWDGAGRLVGTSDARGCGVDIHYDGLNRVVGEDYSPCRAGQPDYTPANLATGEGLEVQYRYDTYEAGQASSEPGFGESSAFARGRLVAVHDRGSHTRFNYDNRGLVRRVSRRLAKPPAHATAAAPYTDHWYKSRLDYDDADQLVRRTTGADVLEMLALDGKSEETYAYNTRGLLESVGSSYGPLVRQFHYDPDGAIRYALYGDQALTRATFNYDERRRVSQYLIDRDATPVWSMNTLAYPKPDATTTQRVLADFNFTYDDVGNPTVVEDLAPPTSLLPYHAPLQRRDIDYDAFHRVTSVAYTYPTDGELWMPPYAPEMRVGDTRPIPVRRLRTRAQRQIYEYDGLGNIKASYDNDAATYDRSLGEVTHGAAAGQPNQLRTAEGIRAWHDAAGNLVQLRVVRDGWCAGGVNSSCDQIFAYDWDEAGQLLRARRWDISSVDFPDAEVPAGTSEPPGLPATSPAWDVDYAYSLGARVRKSAQEPVAGQGAFHTLEIFDTLRLERVGYDEFGQDYVGYRDMRLYLAGMAQVLYAPELPNPSSPRDYRVFLQLPDHLGSATVAIDHASGELVERTTYLPYGAIESSFRPDRWGHFRESYKFTGKEEDIEVGLTYFGARYYSANLGRFVSPDPLTIHGLGADLNPYAYVGGRVMTHVDPWGLEEVETITVRDPRSAAERAAARDAALKHEGHVAHLESMLPPSMGRQISQAVDAVLIQQTIERTLGGPAKRPGKGPTTKPSEAPWKRALAKLDEKAQWVLENMPRPTPMPQVEPLVICTNGTCGPPMEVAIGMVPLPGGGGARPAAALSEAGYDANKIAHIFHEKHLLHPLVKEFGSQEAALAELHNVAQGLVTRPATYQTGAWVSVQVRGMGVAIKGAEIHGVFRISTATMRPF